MSIVACDYRWLNNVTTPDRYPVLHIQDFSAHLVGQVIFSEVDLSVDITKYPTTQQKSFIPQGAHLLCPLYWALKGKAPRHALDWSVEMCPAFGDVKSALAGAVIIAHPAPT